MEKTITFEMPESEAKNFEKLLDTTLKALRRMEKEGPERATRIAQTQIETGEIKRDIQEQLAILKERNNRLEAVQEQI